MKKAFFALLAVLFTLTVVTCDINPPAEQGKANIIYDENDQPWGVNLTISAGTDDRAMTAGIAKLMVNYYEVAFKSGSQIYRTSWRAGETGKLAVPFGDYDTADPSAADSAIIFAGRYETKTLLAVGLLTSGPIDSDAANVTFTLTPLTTDVSTSFEITDGPDAPPYSSTIVHNGDTIPLFYVKPNTTNEATLTIGGISSCGDGIFIQTPSLSTSSVTSSSGLGFTLGTPVISPATGAVSTGVFEFALDVPAIAAPATSGLSSLSFDIPVRALDQGSGDIWHILGGFKNAEFDLGATTHSLGGTLLFATEDQKSVSGLSISNIEIGSPAIP